MELKIRNQSVGGSNPIFFIAEIGINHNGSLENAKRLIDIAAFAGCDAVKFQKRTPHLCVSPKQMKVIRDTPWGKINYLQYRYKVEFEEDEYDEIDKYCKQLGILWFASCWDIPSIDFFDKYDLPCYKIPSACFTDKELLKHYRSKGKPIIASCGMSDETDIDNYFKIIDKDNQILLHTNSSYPAPVEELNMRMISTLKEKYNCLVGYSGHEPGLFTTLLAIPLGASVIERHITLDRNMWGSDHEASIEPKGLNKLIEEIKGAEAALGDGVKKLYSGEEIARQKLRRNVVRRKKGNVGAIVQARIASTRLPGKVLEDLNGKPLLERIIERLKLCKQLDSIIIAIPDNEEDDILLEIIKRQQVDVYRGSEADVYSRYIEAAEEFNIDYIVRVPADNPCISPHEIGKLIEYFMVTPFDFCSNLYEIQGNGYPDGIGAEVFTYKTLKEMDSKAQAAEYREHVHRYFYDHLNVGTIMCPVEYAYPTLRLDVNTQDDLNYIRRLYTDLGISNKIFDIMDIIEWHKQKKPEALKSPTMRNYKLKLT